MRTNPTQLHLDELRNGSLELVQNVPNPFDYSTEIDFRIAKPGLARLKIINRLGELVYVHEDNCIAGISSITWDRNQTLRFITPGLYRYRLESNGEEVVKEMMIEQRSFVLNSSD